MSEESNREMNFEVYLDKKTNNPESLPANLPSTRFQILIEDVIEETQRAESGTNKVMTAIKSGMKHTANVIDQYQAIDRLTTKIRDPRFKAQFQVVLSSMKKECNTIQAKLDKAEREGTDVKAILKALGEEAKQERKLSKSTTWRQAGITNLKEPLITLAQEITMSTKEHTFEVAEQLSLRDYIEEFRLLCIDFIIPLAKCYNSKAYLCVYCWTILFLKPSSTKTKNVKEDQFIPLGKLISVENGLTLEDHQLFLDQVLSSTQELLSEECEYPSFMPSMVFPGEAKKGNEGHRCMLRGDDLRENKPRQLERQSDVFIGKRKARTNSEQEHSQEEELPKSSIQALDKVINEEELEKFEEITLYFKKGKAPVTLCASMLRKIVMKAKQEHHN